MGPRTKDDVSKDLITGLTQAGTGVAAILRSDLQTMAGPAFAAFLPAVDPSGKPYTDDGRARAVHVDVAKLLDALQKGNASDTSVHGTAQPNVPAPTPPAAPTPTAGATGGTPASVPAPPSVAPTPVQPPQVAPTMAPTAPTAPVVQTTPTASVPPAPATPPAAPVATAPVAPVTATPATAPAGATGGTPSSAPPTAKPAGK